MEKNTQILLKATLRYTMREKRVRRWATLSEKHWGTRPPMSPSYLRHQFMDMKRFWNRLMRRVNRISCGPELQRLHSYLFSHAIPAEELTRVRQKNLGRMEVKRSQVAGG